MHTPTFEFRFLLLFGFDLQCFDSPWFFYFWFCFRFFALLDCFIVFNLLPVTRTTLWIFCIIPVCWNYDLVSELLATHKIICPRLNLFNDKKKNRFFGFPSCLRLVPGFCCLTKMSLAVFTGMSLSQSEHTCSLIISLKMGWHLQSSQFGNYVQASSHALLSREREDRPRFCSRTFACQPSTVLFQNIRSSASASHHAAVAVLAGSEREQRKPVHCLLREQPTGSRWESLSQNKHCHPSRIPEQHKANYEPLRWRSRPQSVLARTRFGEVSPRCSLRHHKWCFRQLSYIFHGSVNYDSKAKIH